MKYAMKLLPRAEPVARWQAPFDAEVTDLFKVQSDIAERVAANPLSSDGVNAPVVHRYLAWIYVLAGDTARALDVLTPLQENKNMVTPAEIRIDSRFEPLRGNPRFDRLIRQ